MIHHPFSLPPPRVCSGKQREGPLWGAGNDLHLDPGGKNSRSWTLKPSVLCSPPAIPPPLPLRPRLSSCSLFSSACQGLLLGPPLLVEHLPSPSCFLLLPLCFLLLLGVLQDPLWMGSGEAALLREGGTGQRPWFPSPGQANCRLGCGEDKV